MRVSIKLLTSLMFVALLLAGCLVPMSNPPVEPDAGQWPTWVLPSGSELLPPPPPDQTTTQAELEEMQALVAGSDEATLQQIAYWDSGAPSYRWIEIALNQFKSKPLSNLHISRGMSLLNVAIYDAMVATWNAKYTYNRPRPSLANPTLKTLVATPSSPAYPAEHAVAAGAAAVILGYLYPDDEQIFQTKAAEAAHSRVAAGVQYPSDVEAGLELGRQVAQMVLERATADGSDALWEGTIPIEPGYWTGENPIVPLAGIWQPWVLTSGDEMRPPAPSAYDSPAKAMEVQEIATYTHTWQTNQKALYWQTFDGLISSWYGNASQHIFEHHLDTNPPEAARIYALMSTAQYDALIACWDAKYAYWAMRPFQLDPELVTLFPTPNHPSYPAAHGCSSAAFATILAYLFPEEAELINAMAEEAGMSRLWGGIHYRSDIETGLELGRAVAQKVIEHQQQNTP